MPAVTRHLVLDNEAAVALLSADEHNPKRAAVIAAIAAANGRRVVPSAVRVEAGWDRSQPRAANANRLVKTDDVLDAGGADRAVQLRSAVPSASVVDATVAVATVAVAANAANAANEVVEILTSDKPDLMALAGHLHTTVDVVRM